MNMASLLRRSLRPVVTVALLAVGVSGCSHSSTTGIPTIVVTHEVLATVVRSLVASDATVKVLMPNGKDPHEFEPSAGDIRMLDDASLVVVNGAGFEPQLSRAIDEAENNGIAVFDVSDHLTLRTVDGVVDPHFFLDPESMLQMLPELAAELAGVVENIDTIRVNKTVTEIKQANTQVLAELSVLKQGQCRFIAGHESLGYFADRYGCEVLGTIVDGFTGEAEVSADHLVALVRAAKVASVHAIFVEESTPTAAAQTLAKELAVSIVKINSHSVPTNGTYIEYMSQLAHTIAQALRGKK